MTKKRLTAAISTLILTILFSTTVSAAVSVGVKEGDYITYLAFYKGAPPMTYPDELKIDVTNIQGTNVTAKLTIDRLDGTTDTMSGTYDLETGVPDLLLIPAGLIAGDEFTHKDYGKITIAGTKESTNYTAEKRTLLYATIEQATMYWDKNTGILLESQQTTENFTQSLTARRTNIFQTRILGLDQTIFYTLLIVAIAIVAVAATLLYRRKK